MKHHRRVGPGSLKRFVAFLLLLSAPTLLSAQRIISGPVVVRNMTDSGSTQLLFAYVQQAIGDQTNEAATCGTDTVATTCIVPATFAAGHLALVQIIMGSVVTVTSAGAIGTYVGLGNLNTDGLNSGTQYSFGNITNGTEG
jgi:hypothetical protein